MDVKSYDVVICGAGPAGLIAAAAMADLGHEVLCVDPMMRPDVRAAEDLRSTAILQPGQALLERLGLWEALAPHAMPLQIMRLADAASGEAHTQIRDFDAAEISSSPFGWNVPNSHLKPALYAAVNSLDAVTLAHGVALTGLVPRLDDICLWFSDGQQRRARLAIGADGRGSTMRRLHGIEAQSWSYGQSALTFSVSHEKPHENISVEIHREGGPFTLVPLPDRVAGNGQALHMSAVVWMDDHKEIRRLEALDPEDFEAEATARSAEHFGALSLQTARACWPMTSQIAQRFDAPRTALIAEAAHVIPPIGAQGLNMSLADIRLLHDLLRAQSDPGAAPLLRQYHHKRWRDVRARLAGIDLLNRTSQAKNPLLRAGRAPGLALLHRAPLLRRAMMRLGLGAS